MVVDGVGRKGHLYFLCARRTLQVNRLPGGKDTGKQRKSSDKQQRAQGVYLAQIRTTSANNVKLSIDPNCHSTCPPGPAFRKFLDEHPDYRHTEYIDLIRLREFSRLDEQGHVYLDYGGGCPFPQKLVNQHQDLLRDSILGNPHSHNLAASKSSRLLAQARSDVLHYFQADPREYLVIFTANASAALKLIGESYPFAPGGELLLTVDNHNSVQGIREYAYARGAQVRYIPVIPGSLRTDIPAHLAPKRASVERLLAYPAQSNFSGVQHPLEWIDAAREAGYDVLLDAAAFVSSNPLDLRRIRPDFVCISFYKMFGYPTGVGALLARRAAVKKLTRPSFCGGTVKFVTTTSRFHAFADDEVAFEDGTVNYLSLPAVSAGLEFLESVGMDNVHRRVALLTSYLLRELNGLRHDNGRSAIELYGPRDVAGRGGAIAFNIIDPAGAYLHHEAVERIATEAGIALRSGCFCNPGAAETALRHTPSLIDACLSRGPSISLDLWQYQDYMRAAGRTAGALRASFGLASNFADAYALGVFLRSLLNRPAASIDGCESRE
jgi:molybdenum cofactor sulfurtransferase